MEIVADPDEMPVGAHDAERPQPRVAPNRHAPQHRRGRPGVRGGVAKLGETLP